MKRLFLILSFVLALGLTSQAQHLVCKQINYVAGDNDCPLTICINQEFVNCPQFVTSECEDGDYRTDRSLKFCSTIEHRHSYPFSEICYYQLSAGCLVAPCELLTTKITISRGALGETLTLTGASAVLFTDMIFNNQPGNLNIGTFRFDCEGNALDPNQYDDLWLQNFNGDGSLIRIF